MMVSIKGVHFEKDMILTCVRSCLVYPLSSRHLEEVMQERGVSVDHTTINRWVLKYSPLLEAVFHRRKRPIWVSWSLDETFIRVRGQWRYLYRAVDIAGHTFDFLLMEHRGARAAMRFLTKAITTDNAEHDATIEVSQVRYHNNIVEQDHRAA